MSSLITNKRFLKDIATIVELYPELSLGKSSKGFPYLKGSIRLFDDRAILMDEFHILIQFSDNYPFEYPKLYEIGGRFPRDFGFHIYKNGLFCLTTEVFEILETRLGISTLDFIKKKVIPHLAWRVAKLENFNIKLSEFDHGFRGIIQSYQILCKTEDLNEVSLCLNTAISTIFPKRNDACFCGSVNKYKYCHNSIIEQLIFLPKDLLIKHQKELANHIKSSI